MRTSTRFNFIILNDKNILTQLINGIVKRKDAQLIFSKINFVMIESFNKTHFLKIISSNVSSIPLYFANLKVNYSKSTINALDNKLYFVEGIQFKKCRPREYVPLKNQGEKADISAKIIT